VAEVEDPRYFSVSETGDPQARLRLYDRLGAKIVGVPYFQPRLEEGANRVQHLMLMAFVLNGAVITESADRSVPTAPVAAFLEDYFAAYEGLEVLQDPEFRRLRDAVASTPQAPLLGADELDRLPVLDSES
jgi:hypothetical protein